MTACRLPQVTFQRDMDAAQEAVIDSCRVEFADGSLVEHGVISVSGREVVYREDWVREHAGSSPGWVWNSAPQMNRSDLARARLVVVGDHAMVFLATRAGALLGAAHFHRKGPGWRKARQVGDAGLPDPPAGYEPAAAVAAGRNHPFWGNRTWSVDEGDLST